MYNIDPGIGEAFRSRSLRCTPQRYAVLNYLMGSDGHATAEEIYRAVNASDPRATRATIYNNLHALIRAGLVREVVLAGGAARFDANMRRHHHFVCDVCGAVKDVEWFDLDPAPAGATLGGHTVRNYEIVFRGACKSCAAGRDNRRR